MKTCTLVSSRWNSVISNSKKFLEKAKVIVDLEEDHEVVLLRNYRNIEIISQERYILDKQILNQFVQYCSNLKSFGLKHRGQIHKRDLIEFLQSCLSLEELDIRDCIRYKRTSIEKLDDNDETIILLPKLKSFINSENYWIFNCLKCTRLEIFNYTGSESSENFNYQLEETDTLINFINSLEYINILSLHRVMLRRSQIELNLLFKWNKLNISEFDEDPDDFSMENWKRLLRACEKGSSIFINAWDDRYLVDILNEITECGNTESIKIVENSTEFFNQRFYEHLNPMTGVKNFEFEACAGDYYGFQRKLYTKLPNVECFNVSNAPQNLQVSYRIFSQQQR